MTTIVEERPTEVEIDPRFVARRETVAQEHRRRRRGRLVAIAAVLGFVAAVAGSLRSPLTDVDHIAVTGVTHATADEVVAAAGIKAGGPMLDVDTEAARKRLERLLPWVLTARVTRSWPSTVRIAVVEREAVAQVRSDAGLWFLLDVDGRLLEEAVASRVDLVTVAGTVPGALAGAELADGAARGVGVLANLTEGLRSRITAMRYVPGGEVEFTLRPEGVVAFGRPETVDSKLTALDTVLARVDLTCLASIDVRVPTRPLVRRTEGCG